MGGDGSDTEHFNLHFEMTPTCNKPFVLNNPKAKPKRFGAFILAKIILNIAVLVNGCKEENATLDISINLLGCSYFWTTSRITYLLIFIYFFFGDIFVFAK